MTPLCPQKVDDVTVQFHTKIADTLCNGIQAYLKKLQRCKTISDPEGFKNIANFLSVLSVMTFIIWHLLHRIMSFLKARPILGSDVVVFLCVY